VPAAEPVVIVGAGVVGCAVADALAQGGVQSVVLEAGSELGLGASGANSGILHTGFDSVPGELETRLILRAAALREQALERLGVSVRRCGALLSPQDAQQVAAVARLADNARVNGVAVELDADGSLLVPGESISDPVEIVRALAAAARARGTELRLDARAAAIAKARDGALQVELADGQRVRAAGIVNCAGLFADEVARMAGDELVSVYPRKGEFLVFEGPPATALERILLPVPSALGKGVLVFPTLDGHVIAGPTARERVDKGDWSVEADAAELIIPKAVRMYPALEGARPIAAYAGLRPAGRDANYVIERSRALPGVIHVAAIRSTGLSAALAIGELVMAMLAEQGLIRPATRGSGAEEVAALAARRPWWVRAAARSGARAGERSGG